MTAIGKLSPDALHSRLVPHDTMFLDWSTYQHDGIVELLRSKALLTVGQALASLSPDTLQARGLLIPFFWTSLLLNQTCVAVHRVPLIYLSSAEEHALYAELLAAQGDWQNALSIAEQARTLGERPMTKGVYGAVLTHFQPDQGAETLRAAIREAEAQGEAWHSLYFSTTLIQTLFSSGVFVEAAFRGQWCMKTAQALGFIEEPALGHHARTWMFAQLLTQPTDKHPTGVRSTSLTGQLEYRASMADQLLVQDDISEAVTLCQVLWEENIDRSLVGPLGHMFVRALLERGDVKTALRVAQEAHGLTLDLDPTNHRLAVLAHAMTMSFLDPASAIPLLEQAFNLFQTPRCAVRSIQAGLHLIRAALSTGAFSKAHEAANLIRPWFCELGLGGVAYLAGPASEFQAALNLLRESSETLPLRLQFLGAMEATRHGEALLHLRKRHAELLVLLVLHPEGLRGEELAAELYEDEGTFERCKVEIGRLKSTMNIGSRPYRLLDHVEADFLTVIRLVQEGELRQAVALYHGPLLSWSTAPGVVAEREYIDETLRQAALHTGDPEALWGLAQLWQDDLELWEALVKCLPASDPRRFQVQARVKVCTESWERHPNNGCKQRTVRLPSPSVLSPAFTRAAKERG